MNIHYFISKMARAIENAFIIEIGYLTSKLNLFLSHLLKLNKIGSLGCFGSIPFSDPIMNVCKRKYDKLLISVE